MKRWLWYLGIVAAVAALSGKTSTGQDIGKLQPVQTVYVTCANGMVIIQTDTGDWGTGEDLPAALLDMKAASAGEVFLETADYLVLSADCIRLLPAMMNDLRPSCGVCLAQGEPDLERAGAYFQLHAPSTTLMRWRAGEKGMQTLITQDGRMQLVS